MTDKANKNKTSNTKHAILPQSEDSYNTSGTRVHHLTNEDIIRPSKPFVLRQHTESSPPPPPPLLNFEYEFDISSANCKSIRTNVSDSANYSDEDEEEEIKVSISTLSRLKLKDLDLKLFFNETKKNNLVDQTYKIGTTIVYSLKYNDFGVIYR